MILKDKVALVTGAGRGIGRGIALRYAQEGAGLALADIDADVLESTAAEVRKLGCRAWTAVANLADPFEAQDLVKKAASEFGRLDILVNNAGRGAPKPMMDLTPDDWDLLFEVNVKGLFFCLQEAARQMIARGQGGRIVNIASTAGKLPNPRQMHYAASKATVISITRSAALTLAPHKINVNSICPGIIDTRFWEQVDSYVTSLRGQPLGTEFRTVVEKVPLGRAGTPTDVAGVALFLVSPDSEYLTGQSINIDGGFRMD